MRGAVTVSLLAAAIVLPSWLRTSAQKPPFQSAHDLVRDVMYNEMHDRDRDSYWQYRSERISPEQNVVREQVETSDGPVFRILEENGSPLDAAQQQHEDRRLDEFVHDPAQIERVRREHEDDEARLASIMQIFPNAFLFDYQETPAGSTAQIAFRPNPSFTPSTYVERIVHAVHGTLTVDLRQKRLIAAHGAVAERVDFGYGLFGHIDQGSWFDIHRQQVSAVHWKANLVDVHVEGKMLLFKTVSKVQREARSDFRPVPAGTTPVEAEQWLDHIPGNAVRAGNVGDPAEAHLTKAGPAQK